MSYRIVSIDNRAVIVRVSDNDEAVYGILSIDIGVIHLGVSVILLDEEFNYMDIIWVDLINITNFIHPPGMKRKHCHLHHTKTFTDWLEHFFLVYNDFFEMCDYILIEKQPPMGFVVIEQLIFSKWRNKSILISPNSMHSYFKINDYDYEQRKEFNIKIMNELLNSSLQIQTHTYERTHDIADSICMTLYWASKKQVQYKKDKRRREILQRRMKLDKGNLTSCEWLELHAYIPREL